MLGRKDFNQYSSITGHGEKSITAQIQDDEHLYHGAGTNTLNKEVSRKG
jgi:hypothetical protein